MEAEKGPEQSNMDKSGQDLRFGWGRLRPRFLQVINGPMSFLISLSFLTILKAFLSGYLNQMIPTIEKRFQMTSKDMGIITMANDIPGLILIGFVSYFGEHGNKVKWLGYGALLTGLGSLLSVLPHLIVGDYRPVLTSIATNASSAVCANATTGGSSSCVSQYDTQWYYLFIFVMSQILMGIGSTPLFTLGPAYLDENVHPKSVPVYIGIWYSATWLGPGLGFILGGYMSTIYVDINLPKGINMTPADPRWIGAWWLGYLVVGILNIVFSVIMLGFPRELPGARQMREKAMEEGILAKRDNQFHGKVKQLLPATGKLLRNGTFMWNSLALTVNILYIQGMSAFLAKIINLKFALDFQTIGMVLGSIFTPTGIAGILLGGLICRLFNLKKSCKNSALTIVVLHGFLIWLGFQWWIPGCREVPVAGLTIPYTNSSLLDSSLVASCNAKCACSKARFDPVCGVDGVTYYTPCHAGCLDEVNATTYSQCKCVVPRMRGANATVTRGYCDQGSSCRNFVWFFVLTGLGSIGFGLISVPTRIVVLRCVPFNLRSYALGFQFVFMKLLGYIPSPVLFGAVVDKSCLLWGESCGVRGACAQYGIADLSDRLLVMAVVSTGLSMIMYFLSYWYYTPEVQKAISKPVMTEFSDTTSQKEMSTILINPATEKNPNGYTDTRF